MPGVKRHISGFSLSHRAMPKGGRTMEQPKVFQAGEGRLQVTLAVWETGGNGLSCTVTGGQLPHVGGMALASLSPRLEGGGQTCDLWTACIPGHKDALLAQQLAKQLCTATGQPTAVSAGIHIDGAGPDEIQMLCDLCRQAAEQYLACYGAGREEAQ